MPIAPDDEWVEKLAAALPELPAARRVRLSEEWGIAPTEMAWLVNAGAVELVSDTVAAGASPADARKWWLGELARRANDAGVELADLAVTPAQVAELVGLVAAGTINDQLARQTLDGVLAGEGDPAQVVEARGLAVLGESDELVAAVDAAIEGNPDVADKVRGGKVQAIGALVGAVMKTTRGKADAATVKRMLEERLLRPDTRGPPRRAAAARLSRSRRASGRPAAPSRGWTSGRRLPPRPDGRARSAQSGELPVVVGGWMRSTRSSSSTGVPMPSRLDVVIHSAPAGSSTTVRSRPYWPERNTSGSPVTAPVPSSSERVHPLAVHGAEEDPAGRRGAAAEPALLGADLGHRPGALRAAVVPAVGDRVQFVRSVEGGVGGVQGAVPRSGRAP